MPPALPDRPAGRAPRAPPDPQGRPHRADTILVATFSGSGYSDLQFPAPSVIELDIDDVGVGSSQLFINNAGEHLAYPTQEVVVKGISAGTHTVSLIGIALDDANDRFSVTIQEVLPAG